MPKAVICMAKTQTQAQVIINRLENAGIASDHISIVMSDHSNRFGQPANLEALLCLLNNVNRLVIPGAGFFIAAGPLIAAIQETPQSARERVVGALIHFGMQEFDATRYEDMVRKGDILMSFHAPDNDEAQRIGEILDNTDVENIMIIGEEDLTALNYSVRSSSF